MMDVMNYLQSAKKNIFRFEYLQYYADDEDSLKYWRDTGTINQDDMQAWWGFVESKSENGIKMSRVRRVLLPMNDYTKMELQIHQLSNKRGDDIVVIFDDEFKKLKIRKKDFWLIDDDIVLEMQYSENGKFLGFKENKSAEEFIDIKKNLLDHSCAIKNVM